MVQIQSPSISEFQIGSKESLRRPKSRFPDRIIVFDELEIILFVNQGLTLSTGSLVSPCFLAQSLAIGPSNGLKWPPNGL